MKSEVFEPSGPTVATPPEVAPLFRRAEESIRELFRQVEIDPGRARISIGDERYLLIRASAFAIDFLDTLVQLYADRGEREAQVIARGFLFDIAHTIGVHDARVIHDQLGSKDPIEKLSAGPVRFAYAGWASVDIKGSSRPVPDDDFCLVYDHTYSFEAHAFMKAGRKSEGPVCIMSAGYSSGWCKASFGIDLTAVEVTCKARGDATCSFVMAPPHKVAERLMEHFGVTHDALDAKGFGIPTYFERKHAEEEVRRSLAQLKETQDELIRKERLATVGLLVSGVAHEVNTPLGVAVTASGVLNEELAGLARKFERNELTKGDLRAFFDRAGQADTMVRTNLERAAHEITKFKRVSVDHTTEDKRLIDVGEYVRLTIESLRPLVRKASLVIDLQTSGDLECVTFPGAIAQIMTNFVNNTVIHATRADGEPVEVDIGVSRQPDGTMTLAYADRGAGMLPSVRAKAFQPFFTTQRVGGTGLGLHIVHSLVADVLHGKITLDSSPEHGTRLVITFPVEPPPR